MSPPPAPFEGFTVVKSFDANTLKRNGSVLGTTSEGSVVYNGSSNAKDDLINQQNKINEYSRDEYRRLQISTQDLEQDYARMDMIRKSEYPKRTKYIWVLAIFVSIGVVVFASLYLQNVLNIKSAIIDLVMVLIVASLLIVVIIVILDINDRDKNDFSKLKQDGSKLIQINEENKLKGLSNISDTDLTNKGCRGKECCGAGSQWDGTKKQCVLTI
jgi:hypothetical protein